MDLNEILAFSQLVINKPENEKINLANQFGIDYEEYKKRIIGKEKETEFLIILKSLGCLNHIVAYDEGASHLTNEYTPDYCVELSDGYKMMIEVKHTDKEYYKISLGNLQHRIEFAERHSMPLRFAVSIKGFWGLFTTDDLQQKKGKLTIADFGGKNSISWLDAELATCSYMMPHDLKIRSVYMKNHKKGTGIFYNQYGQLVSYELYCDEKKLFRFKGTNSKYKLYSIYLEALQNRLANAHQEIVHSGDATIITEYFNKNDPRCIIPEYEFLLAPIKHIVSDIDSCQLGYDSMRAVADKDFRYLDVRLLRAYLIELSKLGMDITVFRNSNGYRIEDYKDLFWIKK